MSDLDTVAYCLDDPFASREGSIANGTLVFLISDGEPVTLPARMLFGPGPGVRIRARVPWATYWARFGRAHPAARRAKAEYRRRRR